MAFSSVWGRRDDTMILPAEPEDYERISLLHAGAFARGWGRGELETLNNDPAVTMLVARQVGTKPGNLDGFNIIRQAADEGEILSIVVDAGLRGSGLGGRLMREAITRFQTDRLASVFLEVAKDNTAAVSLYKRLGFVTVGERKSYYPAVHPTVSTPSADPQTTPPNSRADKGAALVMRLGLV
ncbi:MAG: N-acetyltransferase [Pseudomonadota bacterium]